MEAEKTLVNVNKGQDPYSVIGNYILNHVTAIEDMIAVIRINGVVIKELYMADVEADGYFYWENDWWEGEEDVALLDFFPVSDAERIKWIPVTELLPAIDMSYPHHEDYLVQYDSGDMDVASWSNVNRFWTDHVTEPHWNCVQFAEVIAWRELPEPWKGEDDVNAKQG